MCGCVRTGKHACVGAYVLESMRVWVRSYWKACVCGCVRTGKHACVGAYVLESMRVHSIMPSKRCIRILLFGLILKHHMCESCVLSKCK